MRKLVFGINMTADGYCDHQLGIYDEEMVAYFSRLMAGADTLLYGRKTYEMIVPYWTEVFSSDSAKNAADREFASLVAGFKHVVVVSKTLAPAGRVSVIRDDLAAAVLALKNQPGGNISTGGISLPASLLKLGLIDEFHLLVHPVIAGGGKRLFEGASTPVGLTLVDSKVLKSGIVALHYSKV